VFPDRRKQPPTLTIIQDFVEEYLTLPPASRETMSY
jgi:hypothetical protein